MFMKECKHDLTYTGEYEVKFIFKDNKVLVTKTYLCKNCNEKIKITN